MAADGVVFAEVGRDVSGHARLSATGRLDRGRCVPCGRLDRRGLPVGRPILDTDAYRRRTCPARSLSSCVRTVIRPRFADAGGAAHRPAGERTRTAQTPADLAPSVPLMWIHGGPTAVLYFTAVRGRFPAVFAGVAAMAVVFGILGPGHGAERSWTGIPDDHRCGTVDDVDAVPALVLRPTGVVRVPATATTLERVAQTSADIAADEERTQQLDILNTARPLLKRIASGEELSDAERTECALLEAHLRDRLRAPLMSELKLDRLACEARLRGVDVTFIDDSHLDDDPAAVALDDRVTSALAALCADVLANTESGKGLRARSYARPLNCCVGPVA